MQISENVCRRGATERPSCQNSRVYLSIRTMYGRPEPTTDPSSPSSAPCPEAGLQWRGAYKQRMAMGQSAYLPHTPTAARGPKAPAGCVPAALLSISHTLAFASPRRIGLGGLHPMGGRPKSCQIFTLFSPPALFRRGGG